MRKLELDDQGKLSIGPVGGSKPGAINIAFPSNDTAGVGLNVEATPAAGSERAAIKLGGFTLCQDPANDGTANFGILDANGSSVLSWAAGEPDIKTQLRYVQALADASIYHAYGGDSIVYSYYEDLGEGAAAAAAYARAAILKAYLIAHMNSNAAGDVRGAHKAVDTALALTLHLVPAATNTATLCTLTIAIGVAFKAHGDSVGVHFHDDATAAGYTATSDLLAGNATLANAIVELDALLSAFGFHTINASL